MARSRRRATTFVQVRPLLPEPLPQARPPGSTSRSPSKIGSNPDRRRRPPLDGAGLYSPGAQAAASSLLDRLPQPHGLLSKIGSNPDLRRRPPLVGAGLYSPGAQAPASSLPARLNLAAADQDR
jgi:hypothetical protein